MGGSEVQGQPGVQEILIKTSNKMKWGYNLADRVLANHSQNPDLNSQYCTPDVGPMLVISTLGRWRQKDQIRTRGHERMLPPSI